MFKTVFQFVKAHVGYAVAAGMIPWILFPFAGAVLIGAGADHDHYKSISLGITFIACTIIPFILLAVDSVAGSVISYITDEDINTRYPIGKVVFEDDWGAIWFGFTGRYSTIFSVTSLPLLVIVVTTLFPKLWVVVGPVIGLIGILWLLLWGLKKGYQVRKMLSEHVNNKSIHTE